MSLPEKPAFPVIDISPVISERTGVFPGDTPFRRRVALDFKTGDNLVLSSVTSTLHIGAHADGPSHYAADGESIEQRDLRLYMGSCLVLVAKGQQPGERISWKHLEPRWFAMRELPAPRILIRTDSFPDPDHWNSDFNSLDPDLILGLSERGAKLIGIDTPSIDPESSKLLEAHQAVAICNLAVLEGIVLTGVKEDLYTLIALPLRLENCDAAPVRAILLQGVGRLDS
jgi:arylformamidase